MVSTAARVADQRWSDVAARLRLAIFAHGAPAAPGGRRRTSAPARLSRRWATIDVHGPLTPSELAELERVQRPTATRIVARLELEAPDPARPDPADGRRSLVSATPAGAALLRRLRNAQERLPGAPAARARPRRGRDARARRRDPRAPLEDGERRGERRRSAAPSHSLAVPNYRRYFAGQLVSLSGNWMQMVAEMWLILALTGSGVAVGRDLRAAVPADARSSAPGAGCSPTASRSARLLIVTQTLMAIPALALWARDRAPASSRRGWSSPSSSPAERSTRSTTRPGRAS